jgi:hypothetical protein
MALLATTLGMAHAEDSACRGTQGPTFFGGLSFINVVDRGEKWTYVLQSVHSKWEISPPDRHTSGRLFCRDCASASTGAVGTFYWDTQYHWEVPAYRFVQKPPSMTALERSERRSEWLGPGLVHPNQRETRGIREGVKLGPLSGYAILYRVSFPRISEPKIVGSLFVIDVTDGCVEFDGSIASKPAADGNDWKPLDSLLSEVVVKKSRGADVDYPVDTRGVVRP